MEQRCSRVQVQGAPSLICDREGECDWVSREINEETKLKEPQGIYKVLGDLEEVKPWTCNAQAYCCIAEDLVSENSLIVCGRLTIIRNEKDSEGNTPQYHYCIAYDNRQVKGPRSHILNHAGGFTVREKNSIVYLYVLMITVETTMRMATREQWGTSGPM